MVYVDDMRARFRAMTCCHLLADTDEELHALAAQLDLQRGWHQQPPHASYSHYDLAWSKRRLAIRLGAQAITWDQASAMVARCKATGTLGMPETALDWLEAQA